MEDVKEAELKVDYEASEWFYSVTTKQADSGPMRSEGKYFIN